MKRVLIIGAAYVDVVVNVQRLPHSGEDVPGEWRSTQVGGSAFNVQRALTYAGATADLLAPIGQGEHATIVRDTFHRLGIPMILQDPGADNGWDVSFVEANGERAFLSINGVERYWRPEWFEQINLADYSYVYLSGYELEDAHAAEVILTALERFPHLPVLFDTSPRVGNLTADVVKRLLRPGVLIHGNAVEIQQLGSPTETYQAIAQRLNTVTDAPVVVTLDAQGCYYVDQGQVHTVPGEASRVVNTIGAGDTHCGGLLAELAAGSSLEVAMQRANHLAAVVVAQSGGALEQS